MRCEFCHGIGEVLVDADGRPVMRLRDGVVMIPCPVCIGGNSYCCEGECAAEETGRDGT
jgi:hypothetical protein